MAEIGVALLAREVSSTAGVLSSVLTGSLATTFRFFLFRTTGVACVVGSSYLLGGTISGEERRGDS